MFPVGGEGHGSFIPSICWYGDIMARIRQQEGLEWNVA